MLMYSRYQERTKIYEQWKRVERLGVSRNDRSLSASFTIRLLKNIYKGDLACTSVYKSVRSTAILSAELRGICTCKNAKFFLPFAPPTWYFFPPRCYMFRNKLTLFSQKFHITFHAKFKSADIAGKPASRFYRTGVRKKKRKKLKISPHSSQLACNIFFITFRRKRYVSSPFPYAVARSSGRHVRAVCSSLATLFVLLSFFFFFLFISLVLAAESKARLSRWRQIEF